MIPWYWRQPWYAMWSSLVVGVVSAGTTFLILYYGLVQS